MSKLKHANPYRLVWQSRVGPIPWIKPYTDKALESEYSYGNDMLSANSVILIVNIYKGYIKSGKKHFLVVPITFTSDHIETLHELDIELGDDVAKKVWTNIIA